MRKRRFEYLKALHPNISTYTRSGTAPVKAAARGETTVSVSFVHDVTTEAVNGFPWVRSRRLKARAPKWAP